ncbi:MAG: hypothetical protein EBR82_00700 [Caulobacteraceae bacterium]|nr:hypothetical protein [Caulobacteraceae bacterium]
MVPCKVCNKEFENNKGLSYHISQVHNIKFCDYLVEHELNGVWPLCSCGCGEKVNFFGGKFAKHIGSHGVIGLKRTAETRRKISEIQRGRKLAEEHKNKIGAGVRLRLDADQTIVKKISQKLTGKNKSEQHCKNISETRKKLIDAGEIVINRDKISAAITQRYLDGGFEWSTGQYTSSKTGATCNYRSSWEAELMELLDRDPRVEMWHYEPLTIPYIHEGKTRRYIPDFLVVLDGQDVLVEVKPPSLTDTEMNALKRQAAMEFCDKNGWRYLVWSPENGMNFGA